MAEHGHEHGKESKERGGKKHKEWIEGAAVALGAAGVGYTVMQHGPAILEAASVTIAPYLGLLTIGAFAAFLLLGKKAGGGKKAAHAGGGGHH